MPGIYVRRPAPGPDEQPKTAPDTDFQDPWEAAAGPLCPLCGEPMMRIVNGLCSWCWRLRQEQAEAEREKARELLEKAGHLFSPRARARLRRLIRGEPL